MLYDVVRKETLGWKRRGSKIRKQMKLYKLTTNLAIIKEGLCVVITLTT